MEVFSMVVAIVAISVGGRIAHEYLKTRRLETNGRSSEIGAELDALRERVRVLEEIVTDDRYHLNSEISRLERSDRRA